MILVWLLIFSTGLYAAQEPETQESFDDLIMEDAALPVSSIKQLYPNAAEASYVLGMKFYKGIGTQPRLDLACKFFIDAALEAQFSYVNATQKLNQMLSASLIPHIDLKKILNQLALGNFKAFGILDILATHPELPAEFKNRVIQEAAAVLNKDQKIVDALVKQATPHGLETILHTLLRLDKVFQVPYALYYFGTLYDAGYIIYLPEFHTEKDVNIAFDYYERAAQAGLPEALFAVGKGDVFAAKGSRNIPRALEFLQKAADKKYVPAIRFLGILYTRNFKELPKDTKKAAEYFKQAADLGDSESLGYLGQLEYFAAQEKDDAGLNAEADYEKALHLFEQASSKGDINSNYFLAFLYQAGNNVHKDRARAQELFKKVIDSQDPLSYSIKGEMYEFGFGVPRDLQKALENYRLAVLNGNLFYINKVARVEKKINEQQQELGEEVEIPEIAQQTATSSRTVRRANDVALTRRRSQEADFMRKLNEKFICADGSTVTKVDFQDGYIEVSRDSDKTVARVKIDITEKQKLKRVKKFTYQQRVQDEFDKLNDNDLVGAA